MPRLRILVSGRVQGVGFRWFTQRAARAHGLGGFVQNLPDGSVACEAEGPAERLQAFVADLRRGPRGSHVAELRSEPLPEQGEGGFQIR